MLMNAALEEEDDNTEDDESLVLDDISVCGVMD